MAKHIDKYEFVAQSKSRLEKMYKNNPEHVNWLTAFYLDWTNNFITTKVFSDYIVSDPIFDDMDRELLDVNFHDFISGLIRCFYMTKILNPKETYEEIGLRIIGENRNND